VDTRTKILTPAAIGSLDPPRPLLLAAGRFEILRAAVARDLAEARQRTGARCLVAVIRPLEGELAPPAARAEMAAALRVVDYVLIAPNEGLDSLAAALQPVEIISLEQADAELTRQLIVDLHGRQPC
jgi:bifunctional ADP-heptose synthase (sugar kinase/adenylyltransferase)